MMIRASFFAPILVLALLCVSLGPVRAQQQELDHGLIARNALETHIQPGYARFAEALSAVEAAAADLCKEPADGKLTAARGAFAELVRTWGRIAHVHLGPVRVDNRYERIWFWPDRKGIAQRQVLRALRGKPADYTDPNALGGKSIAVQGLGALELALAGKSADALADPAQKSEFRCNYVRAIAANLKAIAEQVAAEWRPEGPFGEIWLNPGPENRNFLHPQETSFALMRMLMDELTRLRDVELARPLGVTQSRRVLPGPFKRSGRTMDYIAARVAGLRSLFLDTGLADELRRVAQERGDPQALGYVNQAVFELDWATKRAGELAEIPELLSGSERRSEAAPLGFPLRSAHFAISNAVGRLTKLPVGYNASDGD